jgi:hypothetical protein
MKYAPESCGSREILATAIKAKLANCGFSREDVPGCREEVHSLVINRGIRVAVYTTIESGMARSCGSDAIRVTAIYKNKEGQDRGVAKAEKRVNRVGDVEEIVERMYQRMREVWVLGNKAERCSCGAPKFISKAGNLVCADLCWKNRSPAPRPREASPICF